MKQIDYPKLYSWVGKRPILVEIFSALEILAVVFAVGGYIGMLLYSFFGGGIVDAVKLVAKTLLPFIIISCARVIMKAPRPEELFSLEKYGLVPPGKKGKSFPSRHVFSCMLIGTLLLGDFAPIGAVVLLLGVVLALSRVFRGVHFIRDTVVGALIGVFAGAIGLLF